MSNLFTIVTAPMKAIWDAIKSILVDTGVDLGGLILSGVLMSIIIGVVTHLSISFNRSSRALKDE